jgi:hypothetical protein
LRYSANQSPERHKFRCLSLLFSITGTPGNELVAEEEEVVRPFLRQNVLVRG